MFVNPILVTVALSLFRSLPESLYRDSVEVAGSDGSISFVGSILKHDFVLTINIPSLPWKLNSTALYDTYDSEYRTLFRRLAKPLKHDSFVEFIESVPSYH